MMIEHKLPARKARVFLIDDSQELRESLRTLLESQPDFEVSGEAATVESALEGIASSKPDLVVLDIQMGAQTGFDVLRQLQSASPSVRVLILSMYADSLYAGAAVQGGARGYLTKCGPPGRIVRALRRILSGKSYFPRVRGARSEAMT